MQGARDAEHLELIRGLGLRSVLVVPLTARGKTLGAITLVAAESGRAYGVEDLRFAEDLARRAAVAVDNSRLYSREHRAAVTLQQSLLPRKLPDIPGVEFAARYLPATSELDVGGDWYDAIPLGDGNVGVAIGDVVGHGIEAAAVMGRFRNALRAYVLDGRGPDFGGGAAQPAHAHVRPERHGHARVRRARHLDGRWPPGASRAPAPARAPRRRRGHRGRRQRLDAGRRRAQRALPRHERGARARRHAAALHGRPGGAARQVARVRHRAARTGAGGGAGAARGAVRPSARPARPGRGARGRHSPPGAAAHRDGRASLPHDTAGRPRTSSPGCAAS